MTSYRAVSLRHCVCVCVCVFSPVLLEVPHFASLRSGSREVCVLRSDNGISWYEHQSSADTDDNMSSLLDSKQLIHSCHVMSMLLLLGLFDISTPVPFCLRHSRVLEIVTGAHMAVSDPAARRR